MAVFTEFDQIPLFRYGLIMADPPWLYRLWSDNGEAKAPQNHYECWDLKRVKGLPVGHLAAPDCVLWLWATNPMLPDAIEVLQAWGFRFATAGHWSKKTSKGNQHFGTGYLLRSAGEPFLIGVNGRPKTSNSVRSLIEGEAREHSRKPEEGFVAAEKLCGDVPRLELFSRQERPGWDQFGNEVGKFEGVAA